MKTITRQQEIDRIVREFGAETSAIHQLLERQFAVLHNRAQVLLTLSGLVVTVTGFSGRTIAGTSGLAQVLIIAGLAVVLAAAAVVVGGVLHLRWTTQHPGDNVESWLRILLAYRDHKTRLYRLGIVLLLVGLVIYVTAVSLMLIAPGQT